jgi:hypothetical protein
MTMAILFRYCDSVDLKIMEEELSVLSSIFGEGDAGLLCQRSSGTSGQQVVEISLPLTVSPNNRLSFSIPLSPENLEADTTGVRISISGGVKSSSTSVCSAGTKKAVEAALEKFHDLEGMCAIYASYQTAVDVLNDYVVTEDSLLSIGDESADKHDITSNGPTKSITSDGKQYSVSSSLYNDRQLTSTVTCAILLDHIHNFKRYSKHLVSWAMDLDITGILFFTRAGSGGRGSAGSSSGHGGSPESCGKSLILIQSSSEANINEFGKLLRTTYVDVDSKGKPCKERMSTVLFTGTNQRPPSIAEELCKLKMIEISKIGEVSGLIRSSPYNDVELASLIDGSLL